jgi:tetratricopeptide (TPR) repeat protein
VWFSKKPEDDPSVQLVDAGLLLASGLPDKALDLASKIDGVRPRVLRAYALIDLNKPKDAITEAEAVLKIAPENTEAKVLLQQARMMSDEKAREAAANELVGLSRKSNSKLASHALGIAYLATGDAAKAKEALTKAVTDVTEASPNPFAYRTQTALAEIALGVNELSEAGKHLDEALKLNSGYFPTRALQAKVVLRNKEPDRALELLKPIYKESSAITPTVELTFAEALATHKGVTAEEMDQAKQVVTSLKDKLPPAEVSRVAAIIDPKLPKELGLPEPESAGAVAPKPPTPPKRHK